MCHVVMGECVCVCVCVCVDQRGRVCNTPLRVCYVRGVRLVGEYVRGGGGGGCVPASARV